jgi:hypothetical protein
MADEAGTQTDDRKIEVAATSFKKSKVTDPRRAQSPEPQSLKV